MSLVLYQIQLRPTQQHKSSKPSTPRGTTQPQPQPTTNHPPRPYPPSRRHPPADENRGSAKELWYEREAKGFDEKGNPIAVFPNRHKRPPSSPLEPGVRPKMAVVSEPVRQEAEIVSLAESQLTRAQADPFVPQEMPRTSDATYGRQASPAQSGPKVPPSAQPEPGDTSVDGGVKIVSPVTQPSGSK